MSANKSNKWMKNIYQLVLKKQQFNVHVSETLLKIANYRGHMRPIVYIVLFTYACKEDSLKIYVNLEVTNDRHKRAAELF